MERLYTHPKRLTASTERLHAHTSTQRYCQFVRLRSRLSGLASADGGVDRDAAEASQTTRGAQTTCEAA